MIYLLHFDRPLAHASHYLGYTKDGQSLEARLEQHRSGRGARLMAVIKEAGIGFTLVRTWEGGRTEERLLKKLKCGPRLCPICNPKVSTEGEQPRNEQKPKLAAGTALTRQPQSASTVSESLSF